MIILLQNLKALQCKIFLNISVFPRLFMFSSKSETEHFRPNFNFFQQFNFLYDKIYMTEFWEKKLIFR